MIEKVATNSEIVSTVTKSMLEASSHVSFDVKQEISYSKSIAVTNLSQCIRDMKKATIEFKSNVKTDVGNLVKIHEAIQKKDENL
ncbi:DUF3130 family protein [Carnobacterium gallinarum]|uniref:DUF3130 family protein n=1 Tax=Carnobacterium gallinarum TaxID=2749 RepID=UPI00055716E5|nr:DUF3130 family protein [Carnobacterium gallinarum]